ncbi:MAG: prepilin-type N-terminal cleavage/methylation domain-containing protein [Phycisphaera sp.]|nr:prepilin-type N-terminal cleavage/methylation domain-containing protein [Phycisphaera sp.]
MCRPRPLHGFTLVELLVVITIIALLIAIFLPALQRAKYQAKLVVCKANLHQVGVGMFAYVSDNNGWYPVGEVPRQWSTELTFQYESNNIKLMILPYFGNDLSVFLCPVVGERFNYKITGTQISYNLYPACFGRGEITGLTGGAYQVTVDSLDLSRIKHRLGQNFVFDVFGQPDQKYNLIASDVCGSNGFVGMIFNHMPPGDNFSEFNNGTYTAWSTWDGTSNASYLREDGSVRMYEGINSQSWPGMMYRGVKSWLLPKDLAQ